ncbi:desi2 [Symbiodinium sp. CCMP2456]|nr:desi2 [Symbiodinium sp. CCMP2456]
MGASIHLVVIPIFGWLVARFGSDHAPVVASTLLLVVWQGLRLIHTDWNLPIFNVLAPVLPQHLLHLCVHNVPAGGLRDACRAAAPLRRRIILLVTPLLGLVLREFAGDFTVMIMIQLCIAAAMLGLCCFGWLRHRLCPTAAVETEVGIEDAKL